MPRCLFERATRIYQGGAMRADPDHDPATHIVITLPNYPDKRTTRWDGATGVRAATAQELDDHDDAEADDNLDREFVRSKIGRLFFELNFDQENRIRALEGKQPVTKAQYRAALKTRYKAL